MVSFGDSLSEVGANATAASLTNHGQPPYFGGRFTVHSATAKVWVENLAATLGLVVSPAEVGFGASSVKRLPAATLALAGACTCTCTGYGQGGSRVTDPSGIGKATGALTVPMKTQTANQLARFSGFKAVDLLIVWGGNNDAFVQFGSFSAAATQVQTDAATGRITADQAMLLLFQAQTTAQCAMQAAALELAGHVKGEVLANGGRDVAVMTLPDSTFTLAAPCRPVPNRCSARWSTPSSCGCVMG